MKKLIRIKKPVAAFILFVFTVNLLLPSAAYALTSGPAQPEMKGFEPASNADLVDAFTGDFTYNIPLLEVGGYPVNIAYHSGSSMDDEASWVGFGWSLNPGEINRQMRGLPDDFNGAGDNGDKIVRTFHMRDDITAGVDVGFSPELFGFSSANVFKLGAQAGILYNNKRGLGIQFGLNANAPLLSNASANAGTNTAGLSAGASLNFNSQNGASFNPSINFSITAKNLSETESNTSRLSLGGSFQSRAGLQAMTLAESFQNERIYKETKEQSFSGSYGAQLASSSISYAAQSFLPQIQPEYFNQSYAVTPQFGGEAWGFFAGLQLTGHYTMQKVSHPVSSYNAYGFIHSNEGKNDSRGLMDFNREKDAPWFNGVPNLPIPVATSDLFIEHAQNGSGQYRAYIGGTGIFSDHDASNTGVSASLGVEVGAGAGFKTGADLQASISKTLTTKWKTGDHLFFEDRNSYDAYGNFTGTGDVADAGYEPVYFKRVGEQVPSDGSIYDKIKAAIPVRIQTEGTVTGASANNVLEANDHTQTNITNKITRNTREVRNNTFSYLTNDQVKAAGLDKKITDYYLSAGGFKPLLSKCTAKTFDVQQQPYKKGHHIGEITITDENGSRKIYGIPAYNTYQEDLSFSIAQNNNAGDKRKGLVSYTPLDASANNKNGLDHFYSKEIIPGYAHSFLLTGILSADYIDLTGDGITDDDPGTAIKFNYWRKTDQFQWRTPYAAGKANYNEGLLSDKLDDRGNYSYGKKELWYLHSIESKNTVAIFETGNREDALGADAAGNPDANLGNRQQYLRSITLYSKADLNNDPESAIPLKTAHFVYDYMLFGEQSANGGIPNNTRVAVVNDDHIIANQGGKLTLKKIYFTYQSNTKGILQPYEFQYAFNKTYEWRQYDRWGSYKAETDNPAGISNDYYPYSTQDKTKADADAACWQLTSIETPAGGIIHITYEADDYMYVQNRKAMQLYPMAGLGNAVDKNSDYYEGDKIYVQLPAPLSSDAALRAAYFDGGSSATSNNLFFKACVKLTDDKELYDYVAGYAEIDNVNTDVRLVPGRPDVAEIKVKKIKGEGVSKEYHPIAKAAWQFMRLNTPGVVYPGYNVREDLGPVQFVKALVGAITSITELLAPFDTRAAVHQLAPSIDLNRSWVRLDATTNATKKSNGSPYYGKLGGGIRVKEISMSDEWNTMSGTAPTAVYGLVYDYTTTLQLADGREVLGSSGVASYEPMIGNEENPFHQPIAYQQKIKLGPDNAFFIDEPLCESYFPAAGIGYSKVTVRNKGADGVIGSTGSTVYEFYTQKDFPTVTNHTPIDSKSFGGAGILQLLKIKKNNSRVVSQGYSIMLNDMHGKPKSEKITDKAGNELSAVYYYYKTTSTDGPEKTLANDALVLQKDGTTKNAVIGRDVEIYSDMRSQTSFTAGVNVMMNVDAIYLLFAVVPIPVVLALPNASYTGFRSASTIKIIQQYGLLDKVVKRQNGAQTITENLAWDAGTGGVLLTRVQNEFDDPVYSLTYPAHWMYEDGMGQAYRNLGMMIAHFSANDGNIEFSALNSSLVAGDELLINDNAGTSNKYWINNAGTAQQMRLVLIDVNGMPATVNGAAMILRSGRRNLNSMQAASLVSLVNPIKNGKLEIGSFTKILDAGASVYNDEWAIDIKNITKSIQECPPGYNIDVFDRCYKDIETVSDPLWSVNTTAVRQKNNLYSTCGTLLNNIAGSYLSASAADPIGTQKVLLNTTGTWQNGVKSCMTGLAGDVDGPLNRCGIWTTERKNNNYFNQWIGIKANVYISRFDVSNQSPDGKTGYLFLGFGSQHSIEIRIDNIVVAARNRNADNAGTSPMRSWRIKPISVGLDKQHEIFIRVRNEVSNSEAVMGVELYNNTYNQLKDAVCIDEACLPCNFCAACKTGSDTMVNKFCENNRSAHVVWSTKCLKGKRFNYHAGSGGSVLTDFDPICKGTLFTDNDCNLKCRTVQRSYAGKLSKTYCDPPVDQVINPFVMGMRGNWHLQKSYSYHTDRYNQLPYIRPGDPDVLEKTDIRKAGQYQQFSAFWLYDGHSWLSQPQQPVKDNGWFAGNETTAFNRQGQELESADVLQRYSAIQFGYRQSLVTAVASNARYSEIGYDGFEDYAFVADACNQSDSCNVDGHFSLQALSRRFPSAIGPDNHFAHTGNHSLRVTSAAPDPSIVQAIIPLTGNAYYHFNGNAMLLSAKGILGGFRPQPGKRYLLSVWIKDDGSNIQQGPATEISKAAVDISTGGQSFTTMKAGPRVEGWRKVEVAFFIPAFATQIKIAFRPGTQTAWFDDLRIQPFDAQMKTYAYNNHSLRLMAALDENNFATFYEYDDEGVLIRTKKETERGIMTTKETRTAFKIKR